MLLTTINSATIFYHIKNSKNEGKELFINEIKNNEKKDSFTFFKKKGECISKKDVYVEQVLSNFVLVKEITFRNVDNENEGSRAEGLTMVIADNKDETNPYYNNKLIKLKKISIRK